MSNLTIKQFLADSHEVINDKDQMADVYWKYSKLCDLISNLDNND